MTTSSDAPSQRSTLKDLVVTAAVATVVSALVSPWLRRWIEPQAATLPLPQEDEAPELLTAHIEKLIDVPNSFPTRRTDPRRARGITTGYRAPGS